MLLSDFDTRRAARRQTVRGHASIFKSRELRAGGASHGRHVGEIGNKIFGKETECF